jgi:hypothetical protein
LCYKKRLYPSDYYTPRNEVVGGYTGFTMFVCRQILCRTITWVVFLRILKFYQLLTGEERMIPFKKERDPPLFTGKLLIKFQNILRNTTQVIIRHRVKILFPIISSPITLERQKWKSSKKKALCRMITWVVFLRMFWNFISSLPVKRGGSLSFLVGTISNVLVMEIG